jgi:serine/threonine-protein kinase
MQDGSSKSLLGSELDKRYRILEPLGEGGMGAVYLGEHIRIGRQVAIKVLNPELAKSDDFLERFEREAIAAGRLDHPNCVPVTDSGHLDDGTAYLVMELVSGKSLGSVLKSDGPQLAPLRALRIIRHVLRGLGHAHDVGIVHRDIKPDNIMLCEREGDHDFARLLDFGIAKLRDEDSQDKAALTQAGVAVGTPAYLSPEQALGDTIDLRSDLYSCSAVLFTMLCGRPPFEAASPIGILTKHASEDPPHLWEIAPHLEDLPDLDALVQRGLAKDRDHRYQSAEEYVQAVDYTLVQMGALLTPVPSLRHITNVPHTGPVPLQARAASQAQGRLQTANTGLAHHTVAPTLVAPTLVGLAPRPFRFRRLLAAGVILLMVVVAIVLSTHDDDSSTPILPGLNDNAMLRSYTAQLQEGKTCKIRLEAVTELHRLGDKRAIPVLKKARRRMRGGLLGVGKKNTNKCLVKAAKKAIESLQAN